MRGKQGFMQIITDVPALLLIAAEILVLVLVLWLLRPNPVVNAATGTLLDSEARANMLLASFVGSESNGERVADIIGRYAADAGDATAKARLEKESEKLFSFSGKDECYAFELMDVKVSLFKAEDRRSECTGSFLVSFRTVFTKEAAIPLDNGEVVTAKLALRTAESRFKQCGTQ